MFAAAGAALLTASCAKVPYTGRRQLLMVSEGSESAQGFQAFEMMRRRFRPCQDPVVNAQVTRVGQRLAQAANRPDYRWEFVVFQEDRLANAFCLPGGKVGVFSGILKYTQDDAGLATVMAHETAHVLARHTGERQSQSMLARMGGLGLALGLGGANPYAAQAAMQGYGLGTQVGLLLPYSRTQEYEADRIGLILMAKAGYDPAQAVAFWERMREHQRGRMRPPEFMSTHPSDDSRLRALAEFVPQARQYYLAAAPAPPVPGPPSGKPATAPGPPEAKARPTPAPTPATPPEAKAKPTPGSEAKAKPAPAPAPEAKAKSTPAPAAPLPREVPPPAQVPGEEPPAKEPQPDPVKVKPL